MRLEYATPHKGPLPAGAKLWSERRLGECCYPIGGAGRATMVCGRPCDGCYCPGHRFAMDALWERSNRMPRRALSKAPNPLNPYPAGCTG